LQTALPSNGSKESRQQPCLFLQPAPLSAAAAGLRPRAVSGRPCVPRRIHRAGKVRTDCSCAECRSLGQVVV
jgi:hypothetical protein